MSDRKIIAVVGATGAQGGGLVRSILADPDSPFAVRAITRRAWSDKAKALARLGADVVEADVDDPDTLAAAFEGAYGAFCMTRFFEHFSASWELRQARALAEAVRAAGVQHVVWSTQEDVRTFFPLDDERLPTLQDRFKVPSSDAKGEADAFFADLPTTYVVPAFYWDNFINFDMGPRRMPHGLVLAMPLGGALLPGVAAEDIGATVHAIFARGPELIGQRIGIAGDMLRGPAMAEAMAGALGEPVNFYDIPFAEFRAFEFPGADIIANSFEFMSLNNLSVCALRDVDRARSINPRLKSFSQWLAPNAGRIVVDA